ncbi:hypothetical protein CBS147325_10011 [Penicillium roqueforti]|nr:hypothetical protein CBS147325_10011 [Penicillium roqueforti]KAI3147991.1 hypothetical protein DTO046C5_10000 [Penicillium roqueforti]
MKGIRKVPYTDRGNFRSRLQRALSLSSSDSEDTRSPSRSVAGDTTEDEPSFPEENDYGGDQENSNPAEPEMVSMDKTDLEDPGQIHSCSRMCGGTQYPIEVSCDSPPSENKKR